LENSDANYINPQKGKFWKLVLVFSLIGIGFILLIVRLVFLQIIDSDCYQQMACKQHESIINLKAERGDIYDRNGKLLATTIKSYSLAIDPTILKDKEQIREICNLVAVVDERIDEELLFEKIMRTKGSFVWLTRGLMEYDMRLFDSIKVRGFIKLTEPKRSYLYGTVGSQIIGCTDIDNKGLTGIELTCDSILKGSEIQVLMLRDAAGRLVPTPAASRMRVIRGNSVKLTIDINLQRIVEHELMLGVKKANSASGTAIIIQPNTGEILAMASYPTYDPNKIESLIMGTTKNRAITDLYEPGSTFKLITAATALEERIATPNTILDGHGGYVKYDDYVINDDHEIGKVSFTEALEMSSNIIFANLAYRVKPEKWYTYVRDFGFGLTYGVELSGESRGTIKNPKQLDAVARRFNGFGYGISVTSLQVVNAYASIANKGEMMKPHVIKEFLNSENRTVEYIRPIRIRRVVSEKTSEQLTEMLVSAVEKGTGSEASIKGLKIAGKTGTAQMVTDSLYSKQDYTASFAGYFPAYNPQLTMLIVIDKPKGNIYGGATAAPIFRNIAKSWISVSKIVIENDNIDLKSKELKMPDLVGFDIFSAARILNDLGIAYSPGQANFIIGDQLPKAGVSLSKTNKNKIVFYKLKIDDKTPNIGEQIIGKELNSAIVTLGKRKIIPEVFGSGFVRKYEFYTDLSGNLVCKLFCD